MIRPPTRIRVGVARIDEAWRVVVQIQDYPVHVYDPPMDTIDDARRLANLAAATIREEMDHRGVPWCSEN